MIETKRLKIDWIAGVIIALLLGMQLTAMRIAESVSKSSTSSTSGESVASSGQETAFASAGEIIVIAAVEIGVILLLWRGYKRLSETWQKRIKIGLGLTLLLILYYIGYFTAKVNDAEIVYIIGMPLAYAAFKYVKGILSSQGLKWLAFNMVALTMGTVVVTLAGLNLSPRLVIVIMVAFLIYDHYAVHLSNVMRDFVQLSSSTKFPNFLVVPNQLRVDLGKLRDFIAGNRDEKPEEIAIIIGLGDFIFPSVLVVSVFVAAEATITLPVITAIVGLSLSVIVLRASLERSESGLPALPYLNTGAIGGYLLGIAVVAVV